MDASASAINDQMAAVSLAPAFARAEPLKGAAVLYAKDLDGSDGARLLAKLCGVGVMLAFVWATARTKGCALDWRST